MANIKGKQLMVVADLGENFGISSQRYTIAYATNHELQLGSTLGDVATKDDNELFVNQEITGQNWSVTSENLIAADPEDEGKPTYEHLLKAMRDQKKVDLYFDSIPEAMGTDRYGDDNWVAKTTPTVILRGYAYITSLELNANNKENVSYTATFTGCGAISVSVS